MESTIAQTPPTTPRSNGSFHGLHLGEEAVSQVSGAPRATRLRHHRKRQQPYVVVLLRMSGPLALRLCAPNMQNLDTNPTSSEKRNRRQSLSAENWIEAALDVISEGGVESVAVEPLARRLGVTKGSFYWHFPNRDALVGRALETWERMETVEMLSRADAQPQPRERLHTLFHNYANTDARSEQILLALSGSKHPAARSCVQRVTEAWRTYIENCYLSLGMEGGDAANWATFAYSTFVGTVRMRRDNPEALPKGDAFNDYLRFLIRSLIPPLNQDAAAQSRVA